MAEDKPTSTNSEEWELDSSEGEGDVTPSEDLEATNPSGEEEEILSKVKEITGREFKNLQDFQKHYKNLVSLVGDQKIAELRKKAEAYEKLQQEIDKEAEEFINSEEGQEFLKEYQPSEVEELKRKVEEIELTKVHPEAEKFLNVIYPIAESQGITLKEAYEDYLKDLVASKLEMEKAKNEERSISVEPKGRISSQKASRISELVEKIRKTDSDSAKQALVREFLSE